MNPVNSFLHSPPPVHTADSLTKLVSRYNLKCPQMFRHLGTKLTLGAVIFHFWKHGACGSQRRELDLLELESQMGVSCYVGAGNQTQVLCILPAPYLLAQT